MTPIVTRPIVWLSALAAVGSVCAGQDRAAVEVLTPNFQVISTLKDGWTIEAARYLETLDRRFRALGFRPAPLPSTRVRVLLLSTIKDVAPYDAATEGAPRHSGLFVPGIDRGWIISASNTPGDRRTVLAHEYVHRIFAGAELPEWLGEGAAEYLSRMRVGAGAVEFGFFEDIELQSLREAPRIKLESLLEDSTVSPTARDPDFRTQARLLVHWLATEGFDLRRMDRKAIKTHIEQIGAERVEAALEPLLEASPLVTTFPFVNVQPEPAPDSFQTRSMTAYELRFVKADLHRETKKPAARRELTELARRFPDRPEPFESLGALEMDQGRYEAAERALAAAVRNDSKNTRTHYRYSLMLQRPAEAAGPGRAEAAVRHARLARGLDPAQPLYLLTEAHARMAAGQWVRTSRLLDELSERPAWSAKARGELAELRRRRQQQWTALGHRLAPRLEGRFEPSAWTREVHAVTAPTLPPISKPLPPKVAEARPLPWPPPGTVLIYGHIRDVECRAGEKILTLRTPRYTVRLRERAERPATLYDKPKRLRGLECGTKGWEVNAVYKMVHGDPEVHGELVAVVF